MLNYKCKSYRGGRAPENRTGSLCMVEVQGGIRRVFARVIPNKQQGTIVPIIAEQVLGGSRIHTDEHGAYCNLRHHNFTHGTVCHKYEFVNCETEVDTQAIESFHNELKLEIKRRAHSQTPAIFE